MKELIFQNKGYLAKEIFINCSDDKWGRGLGEGRETAAVAIMLPDLFNENST